MTLCGMVHVTRGKGANLAVRARLVSAFPLQWHFVTTINTLSGWICPAVWFMEALGLLTYRALLRKFDLSCLTAGPLISSVNCRRLCRRGFYRHIPLLKSSHFMTISINSLRGQSPLSPWGWWKDRLGGCRLPLQCPRAHTIIHTHTFVYIHTISCVPLFLYPPPHSPLSLTHTHTQWWRWFRFFPDIKGKRTQRVEWVYGWWGS